MSGDGDLSEEDWCRAVLENPSLIYDPQPDEVVKRQHTVPRGYLKLFSDNPDSKTPQIHCFDKANNDIGRRSVSDVCVDKHFYETAILWKNAIEKHHIGHFENEFWPVRDKVVSTESLASLSIDEKRTLITFIMVQDFRSRDVIESIEKMIDGALNILSSRNVIGRGKRSPRDLSRICFVGALDEGLSYMDGWVEKPLVLLKDSHARFTTSDKPVIRYNPVFSRKSMFELDAWPFPGVELFFPLSDKLCLRLMCEHALGLGRHLLRLAFIRGLGKQRGYLVSHDFQNGLRIGKLHLERSSRDLLMLEQKQAVGLLEGEVDFINELMAINAIRQVIGRDEKSLAKQYELAQSNESIRTSRDRNHERESLDYALSVVVDIENGTWSDRLPPFRRSESSLFKSVRGDIKRSLNRVQEHILKSHQVAADVADHSSVFCSSFDAEDGPSPMISEEPW